MHLDVTARSELAGRILKRLEQAVRASRAHLRGSLARGTADRYSDIDVAWLVPDAAWSSAIAGLPRTLAEVQPVESFRSDPDFQRSDKHRLIFVRFAHVPLFWRLDLEIFAQSIGEDPAYDRDNPNARGDDWSLAESALANAVAAVKAHLRGDDAEARQLLLRAYRRIGQDAPRLGERDLLLWLVGEATALEPATAAFGSRIMELVQEEWM